MIDVEEAVRRARQLFMALHEKETITDLHLVEVELADSDRVWNVTLGYLNDEVSAVAKHKSLKLDVETGQLRSMKVRVM
ncbi:MAG: hypothetical protein SX243_06135 [Acidobacteriota bacterium]|nr:hypothetical protein [Acidobacteriota bacterium]